MDNYKIINGLKVIIIILFILLFSLFFLSIYNDFKVVKPVIQFAKVSDEEIEIKPVKIPDDTGETPALTIEPVIQQEPNNKENTQEHINSNKFYYDQLEEYSKLIYESLESNKDSLKTGNSKITLPNKISEVIETENAEENMKAVFSLAINAFEYDNPDIFYIDTSKLILFYERDRLGNYNIYLKNDNQTNNYFVNGFDNENDVEQAQEQINNIVQKIEEKIQEMNTDYEKILYIHDWIVNNTKYDEKLSKTNRNSIYGVFIEKEATCGGYAKTFKYLIDRLNINCIIIQGEATSEEKTENHAWNYIQLDNKWYGVDCTWDDPIIIGDTSVQNREIYHTYYLKGQNVFNNSHKPFETFFSTNIITNYPELNETDYV